MSDANPKDVEDHENLSKDSHGRVGKEADDIMVLRDVGVASLLPEPLALLHLQAPTCMRHCSASQDGHINILCSIFGET